MYARRLRLWYKQKAVIKFLTHEGIEPTEIYRCLNVVYDDETMNISELQAWVHKAKAQTD